jgi:hypothetical protein
LGEAKPIVIGFNPLSAGHDFSCGGQSSAMNWNVVKERDSIRRKRLLGQRFFYDEMDLYFQILSQIHKIIENRSNRFQVSSANW